MSLVPTETATVSVTHSENKCRVRKWEYSVAALAGTAATEQHLSQLGDYLLLVCQLTLPSDLLCSRLCELHEDVAL